MRVSRNSGEGARDPRPWLLRAAFNFDFGQIQRGSISAERAVILPIRTNTSSPSRRCDCGARYRNLFTSSEKGFCIIELSFAADGKPVAHWFLEVNPNFEKHSGLGEATGKAMREFDPNMTADWFEAYGKVAVTGEPILFVSL